LQIRALIVDDEPLARQKIRGFLAAESDIEIVGERSNGREALETLQQEAIDLLFLDVQMPELDGFGLLEALDDEAPPAIIFVTAYDHYALRAFEVHAIDYLLKPFDKERFQKSLARARELLAAERQKGLPNELRSLLGALREQEKPKFTERLVIKTGGRIYLVKSDEIDWVEAEGNYVRLHVGAVSHLLRETMTNLEQKLDPTRFLRIHRSTLVNLERIHELQPWFRGDYVVILKDGKKLTLSRGYRERFEAALGRSL
jgi:two-component system LytT family response regulator